MQVFREKPSLSSRKPSLSVINPLCLITVTTACHSRLAIGIVNLVTNFIGPSRVEPWNEVETSCHEWSDAHEGQNRVHLESIDEYESQ